MATAPRSSSSSTILLAQIAIPVKLYTAVDRDAGVHFRTVHKGRCGRPLKQEMACTVEEHGLIPKEERAKGYEFARDHFLQLTDDELDELWDSLAPKRAMEVLGFLPPGEIPHVYFEKASYLGPDKGGERGFTMLAHALHRKKRVALVLAKALGEERLAVLEAVAPRDGKRPGIAMHQLFFASQIRDAGDVPLGEDECTSAELKLAGQLVEKMTLSSFAPEQHKDEVTEKLQAILERRAKGESVVLKRTEPGEPARVIDLFEALTRSVNGAPRRGPSTRVAR